MCRAARSAHGRISTALSTGVFPRDSADPPPTGPGRMCSTAPARPMPHIRTRRPRPDTASPHPPRTHPPAPSHRSRPTPGSLRRERPGDPGRLFWGVCVGRVGLLWRLGAGLCPNLPQRRPEPGSAVRRSAEYQRFSSGVPARLGPLWQIWTIRRLRPAGRGGRRSGGGPAPAPMTPPGPRERSLGRISAPGPVRGARPSPGPAGTPPIFRERAGFQSNAYLPSARSTGNLRVREGRRVGGRRIDRRTRSPRRPHPRPLPTRKTPRTRTPPE